MTTDELLTLLKDWGFTLALVNDQPRLRGDAGKVTPELRRVLGFHREEIIRRLGGNGHEGQGPGTGPAPDDCGDADTAVVAAGPDDGGALPGGTPRAEPDAVRELTPVFFDGPQAYPSEGATIECLWDDGAVQLYPDGVWPVRPVGWRLPGEAAWHKLRDAIPERWSKWL